MAGILRNDCRDQTYQSERGSGEVSPARRRGHAIVRIDINEPRAAEQFWEGMQVVAAAATRHQDYDLYRAIVTIGRAALAQGVELVPSSGLFLQCPVCNALAAQRCVNVPGHPLGGDGALHFQRVDLAEKAISGEVPLPPPLS
ncbi:hypothetical protein [Micromonospora sp. NPDC005189]|uniref:zinc finger domain-containing protein n=1 Tax=Micromonospora sp. NPDC005189 TaxID=3157019 RepID=UPI0033BF9B53